MSEELQDPETQKLRDKISAGQARTRRRSKPAMPDEFGDDRPSPPDERGLIEKTADDHPLALLAGSLIMGVVAANLLQASFGRRLAGRLLGVVAAAGELGANYGSKTLGAAAEAGRAGQERLTRLGDAVAEEGAEVRRRAAVLSAEARRRAVAMATEAAEEAREAGENALKRLGKIGGRS